MIDRGKLLADLQSLLRKLEADLLERSDSREVPEVGQTLRNEYQKAQKANRTAQSYEEWRSDYITQIAAAWVLSCVFARFLEDNRLVDPPRLSGPGERLVRARDEHEIYFRAHPTQTDREYLLHYFGELRKLPGAKEIFGEHNAVHELPNWLSGDAAGDVLKFFQRIDANTGASVHDFTDPSWDTRFLGDLYQDLSETARKKYALLQTPVFVEEFILDRTLDPAINEFGLEGFRMIDPASGSGHFLLGSFHRILQRWMKREPGTNVRVLVQRTLDSVHGVDVNPYAVAIARFRLLLVALRESGISRLLDAPDFHFNLAAGDSLLHGVPGREQEVMGFHELSHHYQSEDLPMLRRTLRPGTYHAVVANPPYITVKDRALNQAYRYRYSSCHMKYSLAVPFMERLFQLAVPGGYTGEITSNSFMKREFGKKLIEEFFPRVDLTHVIDTSGAYIPGHGTPTVILFGRNRKPVADKLRSVMGIRGEPSTPEQPAEGLVWSAITAQVDHSGSQSEFVSVTDSARVLFHNHPWSIGGGGAAELKDLLDENAASALDEVVDSIGPASFAGVDEAFVAPIGTLQRFRVSQSVIRPFAGGDQVRDWTTEPHEECITPYAETGDPLSLDDAAGWAKRLWPLRRILETVTSFGGKTRQELGEDWWTWYRWITDRVSANPRIVFAFVATHNHFVLDAALIALNRSAPVIKLPTEASEDDHFGLLGLLNSSTGCFWMKQIFHDKGSTVDAHGARQTTVAFENFREFTGTGLLKFPLPTLRSQTISRRTDDLSQHRRRFLPDIVLRSSVPTREALARARAVADETLGRMIAAQEELDWDCYRLYGMVEDDLTVAEPAPVKLGQRAFEIVLARKMAAGGIQTTWFERHRSTPITDLPVDWPDDYRQLVERRIALIEHEPNIRLIEQPEYKRRWNTEPWESQLERALREWLLDRMESYFDFDGRMNDKGEPTSQIDIKLVSVVKLSDLARRDAEFMQIGELYRDDPAFDVHKLVEELVAAESVPLLPVPRYKDSGSRKRAEWEQTWNLQRQEDAIDARTKLPKDHSDYLSEIDAKDFKKRQLGNIPVPPKYTSADFLTSNYWRLRGKLDVPKERWVSFPYCEGEDGQMVIAWAGYDYLQLALAISAYYIEVQEKLGGREDPRLPPLLACLVELLPWLKQWHNDVDPKFNDRMGDYFEDFIQEEARQMGKTVEEIKNWQPREKSKKANKRKTNNEKAARSDEKLSNGVERNQ